MALQVSNRAKSVDLCEEFNTGGVNSENSRESLTSATNNCLPAPLVTLIMKYLPPPTKTRNWETEWSGPVGRDVIDFALVRAETPLSGSENIPRLDGSRGADCLSIIRDYLKKDNLYGAEEIEKAYTREKILRYCPNYNRDYPLPVEIDDLMQTPLAERFTHPQAFEGLPPGLTKMTHLIGLYLKPEGTTAPIAQALAQPKTEFTSYSWQEAIQDDANTPTRTTTWRWFGEHLLGRGKSWEIQRALIPAGLETPLPSDTYCVFTKYVCTGIWILPSGSWTRTDRLFEEIRVAFGGAGARGLPVYDSNYGDVFLGVVPCGSS